LRWVRRCRDDSGIAGGCGGSNNIRGSGARRLIDGGDGPNPSGDRPKATAIGVTGGGGGGGDVARRLAGAACRTLQLSLQLTPHGQAALPSRLRKHRGAAAIIIPGIGVAGGTDPSALAAHPDLVPAALVV
jgi:hypothetical protein